MSALPRSLGALSVLLFSAPAYAGENPYTLSYDLVRSDDGWKLDIYAKNDTKKVVNIDDNPFVSDAKLLTTVGEVTSVATMNDYDMMSRAGPRRRWMAVQPGERMLVGSSTITAPAALSLTEGSLSFDVRVTTIEGTTHVKGTVPVSLPSS